MSYVDNNGVCLTEMGFIRVTTMTLMIKIHEMKNNSMKTREENSSFSTVFSQILHQMVQEIACLINCVSSFNLLKIPLKSFQ